MFIGTVPAQARGAIYELMKGSERSEPVSVCCSGNFTIDKICDQMGFKVQSNDVSLYSRTIADIISDRVPDMKCVNPIYQEVFSKWEQHRFKPLVEIMFVMKIAGFEKQKNDFQKTSFENYIHLADLFYRNTLDKLERNKSLEFKIDSFFYGDFRDHFKSATGTSLIFAPTYKGGYEKIFKAVDDAFEYEHASYQIFDSAKAGDIYKEMLETKKSIIYSDRVFEEIVPFMAGIIKTNEKHDIYLYTNGENLQKKFYYSKSYKLKKPKIKTLDREYILRETDKIEIKACDVKTVNYYKDLFMGEKVGHSGYGRGNFGFVFLCNGRAFGFASFTKFLGTRGKDIIFCQSDFVIKSATKRISKLLIMLLLSQETKRLLMRQHNYAYSGIQTAVYTDNPVSMKYRGVYDLVERKKGKLTYVGTIKNEPAQAIFEKWMKR